MQSEKTRSLGSSRLKIGFLAILTLLGGLLAVTKYLDLSVTVEDSMEQGVITAVQEGISAYAEGSRDSGGALHYPAVLDDAKTGEATAQNLFFSNVLQRGIAVEGWTKTGQYEYRTPRGGRMVYDPRTGSFEIPGSMNGADGNPVSQIPNANAVNR